MTMNQENEEGRGYGAISIHLSQDTFWPAVMTVVCLSVVLVESVLAVLLLVSN